MRRPAPYFVINGRLTRSTEGDLPPGFSETVDGRIVADPHQVEPGTRLATDEDLVEAGLLTHRQTRRGIVEAAIVQRDQILQLFTDVAHWNDNVRKPGEKQVNPDPTGEMAKILKAYNDMLEREGEPRKEVPEIDTYPRPARDGDTDVP